MSGREGSVTEYFRHAVRSAAQSHGLNDFTASFDGKDRWVNADELVGISDRLLLVEFKSAVGNVLQEARKESACTLCCGIERFADFQNLHDHCHFVAWGVSEYGRLSCNVAVYRNKVCRPAVLPDCGCLTSTTSTPDEFDPVSDFVSDFIHQRRGLFADPFLRYLRWLLSNRTTDTSSGELPSALYGTSYSHGVAGVEFPNLRALGEWLEGYAPRQTGTPSPRSPDDSSRSPSP